MSYSLKRKLGALLIDWPRFELWRCLSWMRISNRHESLIVAPDRTGVKCEWNWTSDLHICKVFPRLGARLLRKALADRPIVFADEPGGGGGEVQVSFVVGHRGVARLPHLLATLQTIAGQRGIACECIVVEQSDVPEIEKSLPHWVRYVHTPVPSRDMPYCRAWALNVGARMAKGQLLVLHDNDMLVPAGYAVELWKRFLSGYEVINLKRFIFYLGHEQTDRVFRAGSLPSLGAVDVVVQNLEAGGSVAISRAAFFEIGGLDESFVGWGGEDNEFWERAQTRRVWPYGYLPMVHLWHAPQPGKYQVDNQALRHYQTLSGIVAQTRIEQLRMVPAGEMFGPAGWTRLSG